MSIEYIHWGDIWLLPLLKKFKFKFTHCAWVCFSGKHHTPSNSLTDLRRCSPRPHWFQLAFHKKLLLLNYKRFFFFFPACLYKAESLILADWNRIKGTIKWPEMQLAAYYPFLSFQPFCTCVFLVMVIFPESREMHLLYIQLWSKLFLKKTFTESVPVLQEYDLCSLFNTL